MADQQRKHQLQYDTIVKFTNMISYVHCAMKQAIAWLDPDSSGITQSIAAMPIIVLLPSMNAPAQN